MTNKKVSDLTAATTLTNPDLLMVVQGGVSKKITLANFNSALSPSVVDSAVTFSDIVTGNVSTTKHGYMPKLPNTANIYYDGQGNFTAVNAGAYLLLSTQTASASTSLVFSSVITSGYDKYIFLFDDLRVSATADILSDLSTTNGASWNTSNNYDSVRLNGINFPGGTTIANNYTISNNPWYLNEPGAGPDTTAIAAIVGELTLFNPLSATRPKSMIGSLAYGTSGGGQRGYDLKCNFGLTTAVNAIRFRPASGNFTSGRILCYGVRNT